MLALKGVKRLIILAWRQEPTLLDRWQFKKITGQEQQNYLFPQLLGHPILRCFRVKHLLAVCPFVVNEEVRQVVPHLAVLIQVGHGGLQGGLQSLPVVFKEPQHCPPHQGSQEREGILPGPWDVALLHGQPRQTEQDPGQQVHDDLQERNPESRG